LDIVPSKVSLSLIFPLSASTPPAGALACAQRATVTGQQCAGGVGSRRAAEDQVMPALVYSHCDASRNRRPTQSANRIYRGAAGGAVAVAKSGAHLRRQEGMRPGLARKPGRGSPGSRHREPGLPLPCTPSVPPPKRRRHLLCRRARQALHCRGTWREGSGLRAGLPPRPRVRRARVEHRRLVRTQAARPPVDAVPEPTSTMGYRRMLHRHIAQLRGRKHAACLDSAAASSTPRRCSVRPRILCPLGRCRSRTRFFLMACLGVVAW